ncbi:acetyl-CoA carboxylase biotin carboxyl carrier protein [Neobacillus sp. MM2021_6]|uniref:acetyl-CoA carboxylase biotin carboxyl carrier protein n=1 Tax=Bacillaceae TaxID=186817 RepID=UPI00140CB256|nr:MULTISPECIES: acetyl-CoA carboxylase biotin carboxyl carrier protein [Bacillaceae]MBO0960799.1 acetyl-CoA carboxylase biotin carboxyl carrier protein [Neobacillus sp. MM2021_6]NHC17077.1 acetyl-CoA carboxylase biotin carboxyl carrier protein [Bacillus sp. MM2020_4]
MLKVQEIRELIKLVDQSSIDEFVYEVEGSKIKMKKNAASTIVSQVSPVAPASEIAPVIQAAPIAAAATAAPVLEVIQEAPKADEGKQVDATNLHKITSPMVGTFYASPTPDADLYVKAGSKVSKDSIVCIVEAMKLFNEIEAEVNGEVVEVLVKNGQLVEYGQPLFLVKPE